MSETANHPVGHQEGSHRTRAETDKSKRRHEDPADRNDREDGDSGRGKEQNDHRDGDRSKKRPSRWPLILVAIVFVSALGAGIYYWLSTRNLEDTDDAYTEGNAISITPKVSGYVVERRVDDNTFVRSGDLMLKIDSRDYVSSRDQARASLALAQSELASSQNDLAIAQVKAPAEFQQAQAQLAQSRASQTNAEREYQRQHSVDPRATTQTTIDQANTQLRSNTASVSSAEAQAQIASLVPQNIQSAEDTVKQREAQVEQAAANLTQAELNLSYTEIHAPKDGYVTRRNVDVGTFAQAGQQMFYLVGPDVWVTANFKETQLARMRPGQSVAISVDAYPDLKLHGHVESVQAGSGARFSAFPAENATGNFVKIVRRVPVKIVLDSGLRPDMALPLGLSVVPTVTLN